MRQIGKSIIGKIANRLSFNDFTKRQQVKAKTPIKSVALLYYVPKTNAEKYRKWEDGFTKAIDLLSEDYDITWFNLEDGKPTVDELNRFDFIITKSCWNWIVDRYVRSLKGLTAKRGIVVSCSAPTLRRWAWFYDVIWYETAWYRPEVAFHPNIILSNGVNSDVFKPLAVEKVYDVLAIGAVTGYKRFDKLNALPGRKLIIGSTATKDFETVKAKLDQSIEIVDYVSQEKLAEYINQSKLVYLPCELQGGGERAVMEALSCGVPVKVEPDNPKLQSLLKNNIPISKHDFADAIRNGFALFDKKVPQTNAIVTNANVKSGRHSFYNSNLKIKGGQHVTIGSFCAFGEDISIITENHDTNYASTQGFIYRKFFNQQHPGELQETPSPERTKGPIVIGNDVWIGDRAIILSGVTIGDGACIAAGSLVNKDVAPYSVVGGVPAKHLKFRFAPDVIDVLNETKWWHWSDRKIKDNQEFFNTNLNTTSGAALKAIIK